MYYQQLFNLKILKFLKFFFFEKICYGSVGDIFGADHDDSENLNQCYALKSFNKINDAVIKVILCEVMQVY
mgnify:CR=1 FL=1